MIPYKQTLGDGGEEQLSFFFNSSTTGLRWRHSFPASGLGGEKKVKVENKSTEWSLKTNRTKCDYRKGESNDEGRRNS